MFNRLILISFILMSSCKLVPEPDLNPSNQRQIIYPAQIPGVGLDVQTTGWAKYPIWQYMPENIPAEFAKQKKEWEHYTIVGKDYSMSITLMNVGFAAAALIDFCHYREKFEVSNLFFETNNLKGFSFPLTPYGETMWEKDGDFVHFKYENGKRYLEFSFKEKVVMKSVKGKLLLTDPPESIAVVRPFNKPKQFFYENKVFAMPVEGEVTIRDKTYLFEPEHTSSILDWGRGVWPGLGSWYWGFFSGEVDGKEIAINMSYGYGNDIRGTVNALLVDGKIQKIDKIIARGDLKNPKGPIHIFSNDGRVNVHFKPLYHQVVNADVLVYYAKLDKLYGTFEGDIVLDDGTTVKIKDFYGFAENVFYKW
ncbi:MAG: DUF2804 domain-containing protein [Deltaproteobacteria bacterium]|nr:MAG: DUF2804 domain-containing protein [Deltaproteobacteria bacterium]